MTRMIDPSADMQDGEACPAKDCDRTFACRPPAPTCPHPFYAGVDSSSDLDGKAARLLPVADAPSLDDLRGAVIRARFTLARALEDACPGPHSYVQHRDRKPPWCRVCGRGSDGTPWGDLPDHAHKPTGPNAERPGGAA